MEADPLRPHGPQRVCVEGGRSGKPYRVGEGRP